MTVMWGDWHVGMFLDANLPTMLAPGNLPALITRARCEYLIHTTYADAERMRGSPAFLRLCELMPVRIKVTSYSRLKNPMALHHAAWDAGSRRAKRRGAFVLLMPPDVVWADGSFARLGEALAAGKSAIFMTYPRVTSESLVPEMLAERPADAVGAVSIPPARMMDLALRHLHPLMMAYLRDCPHFPIHPEMILWAVEGDGFNVRLLARELFCFRPGDFPVNAHSLLANSPPADAVHFFDDSLAFLGLSLTPFWKDLEWYLEPRRLDPLQVGRWWTVYDSPFNDALSRRDLRFRRGTAPEAAWRATSREADALLHHLRAGREFVRVLIALSDFKEATIAIGSGESESTLAARFLAAALRVHGIARRWPHGGRLLILAPTDDALRAAGFGRIPGDGLTRRETLAVLRACAHALPDDGRLPAPGTEIATLDGGRQTYAPTSEPRRCGQNWFVWVEKAPDFGKRA